MALAYVMGAWKGRSGFTVVGFLLGCLSLLFEEPSAPTKLRVEAGAQVAVVGPALRHDTHPGTLVLAQEVTLGRAVRFIKATPQPQSARTFPGPAL